MRVIKSKNIKYVSFYKSLPSVVRKNGDKKSGHYLNMQLDEVKELSGSEVLKNALSFYSSVNNVHSIEEIDKLLSDAAKKCFALQEAVIFLFDSNNSSLNSPAKTSSAESKKFINNAHEQGILEWAFSSKSAKTIPVFNSASAGKSGSRYLVFPLFEGVEPKGIFSVLHDNEVDIPEVSMKYVELIAGFAFQRINILHKDEEKKLAYNTLQSYQSKLTNDYRLSAVGELAGGVIGEILEPLQVIFSSVDLLHAANGNSEIVASIKKQVRKIESSAERLRKFADRSDYKLKIFPCDINAIIKNYHAIISSSLEKKQIECILNLESGLPAILSHSHLINQLLVNVISLLTADYTKPCGIVVQTQFVKDVVKVSFISTEHISGLKHHSESSDPIINIINQLVAKHEGKIETDSNTKMGSKIEIFFPLKRKIRA